MSTAQQILSSIQGEFGVRPIDTPHLPGEQWFEVIVPMLDVRNDLLAVYLQEEGSVFHIGDDGFILNEAEANGLSTEQTALRLGQQGFTLDKQQFLLRNVPSKELGPAIFRMAQAMIRVSHGELP